MGDARIAIDECLSGNVKEDPLTPSSARPLWRRLAPWAAIPVLVIGAWMIRSWLAPLPEKTISRWEIPLEKSDVIGHRFRTGVAFSPDGSLPAFVGASNPSNPRYTVYLRPLDRWDQLPFSDTHDLWMPFFSPDGKWLGVASNARDGSGGKLRKYPLDGGAPTTICDCRSLAYGASWSSDDTIVFACEQTGGLWRVSASGGEPEQITELDLETPWSRKSSQTDQEVSSSE